MFRCEICNVVSPPGTLARHVILETRPAEYPSRAKAQRQRVGRKLKHSDDPGGAGYEIAREAMACPSCANTYEAKQAQESEEGGPEASA